MSNTPIRHMIGHEDALADEFETILGLRTILDGVVRGGASAITYAPEYYNAVTSGSVIAAGLHSSAATADGISFATLPTPSIADFTAGGANPTTDLAKPARWNVLTDQPSAPAALASGGRYKMEVTTAGIASSYAPASTKYFGSTGSGWVEKLTTGAIRNRMPVDLTSLAGLTITSTLKASSIPIECMWGASGANVWMFVDGLPIGQAGATWAASAFNNFYAGGLSSVADSWIGSTHRVQNVTLNSTPFTYTAHSVIDSALFLGDSFTTYGALLTSFWAGAGVICPWNPGYGYDSLGAAITSNTSYSSDPHDQRYIAEFHRQMAKGGFLLSNTSTSNQAESGADFARIRVRAEALVSVPKLVLIGGGTNDIHAIGQGSYTITKTQTEIAALVVSLRARGATKMVFWKPPSLRARTTTSPYNYQTTAYDNITLAVGDAIDALAAANPDVYVVDVFTEMGGLTPDTGLFLTDNIHPNAAGSQLIGKLMGEAAVAALTGA